MKMNISHSWLLIMVAIFYSAVGMAQSETKSMQARLKRSTTGRTIASSGLAEASVPLQKGAVYNVIRQENGRVVLSVAGKQVVVDSGAVTVSEKLRAGNSSGG